MPTWYTLLIRLLDIPISIFKTCSFCCKEWIVWTFDSLFICICSVAHCTGHRQFFIWKKNQAMSRKRILSPGSGLSLNILSCCLKQGSGEAAQTNQPTNHTEPQLRFEIDVCIYIFSNLTLFFFPIPTLRILCLSMIIIFWLGEAYRSFKIQQWYTVNERRTILWLCCMMGPPGHAVRGPGSFHCVNKFPCLLVLPISPLTI